MRAAAAASPGRTALLAEVPAKSSRQQRPGELGKFEAAVWPAASTSRHVHGGRGWPGKQSARAPPRTKSFEGKLQDDIRNCRSGADVLELVSTDGHRFDEIHTTTSIYMVAKHRQRSGSKAQSLNSDANFQRLLTMQNEVIATLAFGGGGRLRPSAAAQLVSNTIWAYATLHIKDEGLFANVSVASLQALAAFRPQHLANVAWSFAVLKHIDERVLGALADAAAERVQELKPVDLANLAWAFAESRQQHKRFFDVFEVAAVARMEGFASIDVGNSVWACAKLQLRAADICSTVADGMKDRTSQFDCQDLANTAWAFATLEHMHRPFLESLAMSAVSQVNKMTAQHLTNLVWSFATLEVQAPKLTNAVADECVRRQFAEFDEQGLSNTAWAFATLQTEDVEVFRVLAVAAEPRLEEFKMQALANMAWSLAVVVQGP
eukprot:TRINITY_DN110933_c0_g1_i1.p1 TRINITY_DN110933_c0_g1~~TRINITY_DN110933_c0_g1_i1.p1  ORF type:complete len:435 (+),score=90.39 TRINITY_DN110933_c0_g1_i1:112-1416(+)